MAKRSGAVQEEIPGTESPNRDPELHALGLEIIDLEQEVRGGRGRLKGKQEDARAALKERGMDSYVCDGVELWSEPQPTKIKAKRPSDRKKGKIQKVTDGEEN
jgi:hypothetical protein